MVESIVIHAGAPKTATTFIQRGLHSNQDLLATHGAYLPATGRLEQIFVFVLAAVNGFCVQASLRRNIKEGHAERSRTVAAGRFLRRVLQTPRNARERRPQRSQQILERHHERRPAQGLKKFSPRIRQSPRYPSLCSVKKRATLCPFLRVSALVCNPEIK